MSENDEPMNTRERLVFAQVVHEVGANDWDQISNLLGKHPLVTRPKAFYSPDKCERLYRAMLTELGSPYAGSTILPDILKQPKSKANLQLARSLYQARVKELVDLLGQHEKIFKQITQDVAEIQSGHWDERIISEFGSPPPVQAGSSTGTPQYQPFALPNQSSDREETPGGDNMDEDEDVEMDTGIDESFDEPVAPVSMVEQSQRQSVNVPSSVLPGPVDEDEDMEDEEPVVAQRTPPPNPSSTSLLSTSALPTASTSTTPEGPIEPKVLSSTDVQPQGFHKIGSQPDPPGLTEKDIEKKMGGGEPEGVAPVAADAAVETETEKTHEVDKVKETTAADAEKPRTTNARAQTPEVEQSTSESGNSKDLEDASRRRETSAKEDELVEETPEPTRSPSPAPAPAPPMDTDMASPSDNDVAESPSEAQPDAEAEPSSAPPSGEAGAPSLSTKEVIQSPRAASEAPTETTDPMDEEPATRTRTRATKQASKRKQPTESQQERKRRRVSPSPAPTEEETPSRATRRSRASVAASALSASTSSGSAARNAVKPNKSLEVLHSTINTLKGYSLFAEPVTDKQAEGYSKVVYESQDLKTIKTKIKTGEIQTTDEYERAIYLMFANAVMYNLPGSTAANDAKDMMQLVSQNIQSHRHMELMTTSSK
ncbi:hypothetical protein DL93DRAFT_2230978 [Clavulina sp. PMI_390]|nr:hypothetical protein DL93DRAFT_2230978 [Clavulina sp. PMI_390]